MTDFDPIAYINEPRWRSSRLGLDRIIELMDRLGNPQAGMRFVHVAGTNGKGSTCSFLSSILQHAGLKVGLFTSPYIFHFSDRIRVDGRNIDLNDLTQATLEVRDQAERMDDHPTEFELMTAVALVHFSKMECDIVVMEVGLGGRYDSTNVIPPPEVCAITSISIDHTELLGSTLEQIAGEKAGIIKRGSTVVSAHQEEAARDAIIRESELHSSDLRFVDLESLQGVPQRFSYCNRKDLEIGLLGSYQIQNAALALDIIDALKHRGFSIGEASVREGLKDASWPGRFQLIAKDPVFIVDGGHNAQGALALADSLKLNYPNRKVVFLMGVLGDKDYRAMIRPLLPLSQAFVCVAPPNPRALPASDLAESIASELAGQCHVEVTAAEGFEQGVLISREQAGRDGIVCACGSLYSIASVMEAISRA